MNEKQQQPSDHDLLVRIDERTERWEKWCLSHEEHHFRYNLAAWLAVISLAVSLAILLIKG